VWKIEKKSLHSSPHPTATVLGVQTTAIDVSLQNLQQDMNAPRYSISGKSKKDSYASKYGNFCQGTIDIGTLLTQQLLFEGHSRQSHQWQFLEAMNQHKIAKEYQLMGDILRDICESNIQRKLNGSTLTSSDVLHMRSFVHHTQNPRYGLANHKAGRVFQETKQCLLELGVH